MMMMTMINFCFVPGQHLILEKDVEKGKEEYAFDNPGFKGKRSTFGVLFVNRLQGKLHSVDCCDIIFCSGAPVLGRSHTGIRCWLL